MPYLVDGHNLIPKIPGLSLKDLDDEDRLIAQLQVFCRVKRQTMELFFDGAPAGYAGVKKKGTIRVTYVPLGSKADDAIAARLRNLGRAARSWRVVTSDRQVQAEARSHGAEVVSSEVFAAQVLDAVSRDADRRRQQGQVDAGDVQEWLDKFNARE